MSGASGISAYALSKEVGISQPIWAQHRKLNPEVQPLVLALRGDEASGPDPDRRGWAVGRGRWAFTKGQPSAQGTTTI